MGTLRIWALGAIWVCAGFLAAEAPKVVDPYKVYVANPTAFVRCGPSEEYYRTDELQPGEELEVYVETEDGWLGVRPPETSFCWIPERQVKLNLDGTAAVVEDPKAVAWVGTNLGQAKKYRWQVRLMQGEQLAVLGSVDRETKTGEKDVWLKIVPPPGEFRWIHSSETAKSAKAAEQRIAANWPKPKAIEESDAKPVARVEVAAKPQPSEIDAAFADEPPAEVAQASFAQPVGSGLPERPRAITPGEVTISKQLSLQSLNGALQATSATPQAIERASYTDDSWQQGHRNATRAMSSIAVAPQIDPSVLRSADLEQLQLMLAQQMAAGADATSVERLRERVTWWIQNGNDPIQRGRAGLMLERMERYQAVARMRTPNAGTESIAMVSGTTSVPTSTTPAAYDQTGQLVQVYSARPGAPPFAITDRQGNTIAYVEPSPGLNLRTYLNKEVGLYGRTGYLTGLETPYLMVEKVVVLSEVRR